MGFAKHHSSSAQVQFWPLGPDFYFTEAIDFGNEHFNSVKNRGHDHGFAKALEMWDDGSHNGGGDHQPNGSRCPARQDPLGTLAHDLIHEGNVVRPRCSHHLEGIADLRATPVSEVSEVSGAW